MKRHLVTSDRAVPCTRQITKPCSDCPFARTALPGWLGDMTPEEWMRAIQGEATIDCHTLIGPQCAGAAIFRANICKVPRERTNLRLPQNPKIAFTSPQEFLDHHK